MDELKNYYYELFGWYRDQLLGVVLTQDNLVFGIIIPKEKDIYTCLVPKPIKHRDSVYVIDIREYFELRSLDDTISHKSFQKADLLFNNSNLTLKNASYKDAFIKAKEKWTNGAVYDALDIVYEFMRQVIDEFNGLVLTKEEEESRFRTAFNLSLTTKERTAYKTILDKYFEGGKIKSANVIVTQVCIDCNISRPTIKSLLTKMDKAGIASISSHGVNGTNIDFLINNLELEETKND